MSSSILAPSLEWPSVLADYIELLAISSQFPRGEPDVVSLCRRLLDDERATLDHISGSDEQYDSEAADQILSDEEATASFEESHEFSASDQDLDEEIEESRQSKIVKHCTDELRRRSDALKQHYPFEKGDEGWSFSPRGNLTLAQRVYLLCLFLSAEKYQLLSANESLVKPAVLDRMFQACATVAAGGVLGGQSAWFGFPRPEGTDFLKALRRVFDERIGIGASKSFIPAGLPAAVKDDGIDVIAWREWPDRNFGVIVLAGQVATGKTNWAAKSILPDLQTLTMWLEKTPSHQFLPALIIPWVVNQELEIRQDADPAEALWNYTEYLGRQNGYIVDRLRVTASVQIAAYLPRTHIDGWSELEQALTWTDGMVTWLKEGAA